jgi:hypothetical protein
MFSHEYRRLIQDFFIPLTGLLPDLAKFSEMLEKKKKIDFDFVGGGGWKLGNPWESFRNILFGTWNLQHRRTVYIGHCDRCGGPGRNFFYGQRMGTLMAYTCSARMHMGIPWG